MGSGGAEPSRGTSHLVEVLDRVLERGIVIDAEARFNLVGLNLVGVEARIVVATIETYLEYAEDVAPTAPTSWHIVADPTAADVPLDGAGPGPTGTHRVKRYFDEDAGDGPWDVGGS